MNGQGLRRELKKRVPESLDIGNFEDTKNWVDEAYWVISQNSHNSNAETVESNILPCFA